MARSLIANTNFPQIGKISEADYLRLYDESLADPEREQIDMTLTRAQIEHSKSLDTADIPLDEVLPTIWVM